MSERDDPALLAAVRGGDRRALEELLGRHYDRIHAICRRVIGEARDADDAAQEAMIRIVRGLETFDGRSSFSTWSHRVATNTALDELRRRSRRPRLQVVRDEPDEVPAEPVDDHAHDRIDAVADRAAIDQALARLPEEFRLAVVLRDVADLDYAEIADELGVPLGTVKSRIARGRALLADELGNQTPSGPRPTPGT
jgi:RNA polymerase sigma-70 factor (ECF subfamily)